MTPTDSIDGLLPPQMAQRAEEVGTAKAAMAASKMFTLAVLAGAFISLGAAFSTTVLAGSGAVPFGLARMLGGVAFSLGLVLVVVGGAELFTGNNLIAMAWAGGRVSTGRLLRNWSIVYVGNFVGCLCTVGLMLVARQHEFGQGAVGATALSTAAAKLRYDFVQAMALGVLCNGLVCLAVWLSFSARTTTDRVLAVVPPVVAFVACGFEHSVANMYFVPLALGIRTFGADAFWASIDKTPTDFDALGWGPFLMDNLLPVTLGNLVGGTLLVGAVYAFVYLRRRGAPEKSPS